MLSSRTEAGSGAVWEGRKIEWLKKGAIFEFEIWPGSLIIQWSLGLKIVKCFKYPSMGAHAISRPLNQGDHVA
jgi:hypothetical protein